MQQAMQPYHAAIMPRQSAKTHVPMRPMAAHSAALTCMASSHASHVLCHPCMLILPQLDSLQSRQRLKLQPSQSTHIP